MSDSGHASQLSFIIPGRACFFLLPPFVRLDLPPSRKVLQVSVNASVCAPLNLFAAVCWTFGCLPNNTNTSRVW